MSRAWEPFGEYQAGHDSTVDLNSRPFSLRANALPRGHRVGSSVVLFRPLSSFLVCRWVQETPFAASLISHLHLADPPEGTPMHASFSAHMYAPAWMVVGSLIRQQIPAGSIGGPVAADLQASLMGGGRGFSYYMFRIDCCIQ